MLLGQQSRFYILILPFRLLHLLCHNCCEFIVVNHWCNIITLVVIVKGLVSSPDSTPFEIGYGWEGVWFIEQKFLSQLWNFVAGGGRKIRPHVKLYLFNLLSVFQTKIANELYIYYFGYILVLANSY